MTQVTQVTQVADCRKDFTIRGKDSLEVQRPDQTKIADSYAAFFVANTDVTDGGVTDSSADQYWTGLEAFGNAFILSGTCSNWTSGIGGSNITRGNGGEEDSRRLYASVLSDCTTGTSAQLLCITH